MNDTAERKDTALTNLARAAALVNLRMLRKAYADYEDDVREWYSRGDGRSPKWHTFIEGDDVYQANVGGKGYAYPECIHGRSLWVDHDIPCGECEAGLSIYELALMRGYAQAREFVRRTEVVGTAHRAHAPHEIVEALTTWSLEALPSSMREFRRPFVRDLP